MADPPSMDTLSVQLGIRPSAATEALFQSIYLHCLRTPPGRPVVLID